MSQQVPPQSYTQWLAERAKQSPQGIWISPTSGSRSLHDSE